VTAFDGWEMGVACGAGTFQIGKFNSEALKAFGFDTTGGGDGISSLIVPRGLAITLYLGDN